MLVALSRFRMTAAIINSNAGVYIATAKRTQMHVSTDGKAAVIAAYGSAHVMRIGVAVHGSGPDIYAVLMDAVLCIKAGQGKVP